VVDLSIVVVSWNAKAYLLQCLESIRANRSGVRLETLVVDNDSSDGSPEAVEGHFPEVRVIRTGANLGFAKANNIGIRQSRGRYFCLVNSDVVVHSNCMERLLDYMDAHPETGLAGPQVLNGDGTLQDNWRSAPSLRGSLLRTFGIESHGSLVPPGGAEQRPSSVDVLSGCFWIARREAVAQVGLLDENFFMYAEDYDWCKRFHASGWDVVYVPSAVATHYGGASSANTPTHCFVALRRASLQYWKKHHSAFVWVTEAVLVFLGQIFRLIPRTVAYALLPSKRESLRGQIQNHLATLRWLCCGWRLERKDRPATP
jgi:GT2 family glycosyltransferase